MRVPLAPASYRRCVAALLLLTLGWAVSIAQNPAAPAADNSLAVHANAPSPAELPSISREVYQQQLSGARTLLTQCQSDPEACDARRVSPDEEVGGAATANFSVHWGWLRQTLEDAAKAKPAEREPLFARADRRLLDDAADLAPAALPAQTVSLSAAQRKAEAILAGKEFRHVEQQGSWLALKLAALAAILSKLFSSASGLLPKSSLFGVALEWGILAIAAIGLGLWAWRTTRQQRLAIADEHASTPLWQAESERWAERAQASAEQGDWREAVHCLYWAAIVMLEGQRLWRENRTRTPRDYVRLLESGSPRATLLHGLTCVFERIWYGLRPAAREDYEQARGLLEQLRSA